jgi:hypothetical protein
MAGCSARCEAVVRRIEHVAVAGVGAVGAVAEYTAIRQQHQVHRDDRPRPHGGPGTLQVRVGRNGGAVGHRGSGVTCAGAAEPRRPVGLDPVAPASRQRHRSNERHAECDRSLGPPAAARAARCSVVVCGGWSSRITTEQARKAPVVLPRAESPPLDSTCACDRPVPSARRDPAIVAARTRTRNGPSRRGSQRAASLTGSVRLNATSPPTTRPAPPGRAACDSSRVGR